VPRALREEFAAGSPFSSGEDDTEADPLSQKFDVAICFN
jgi:hypothetical protein